MNYPFLVKDKKNVISNYDLHGALSSLLIPTKLSYTQEIALPFNRNLD